MKTYKEVILNDRKVSNEKSLFIISSVMNAYIPSKETLELFTEFSKHKRYIEGRFSFYFKGQQIIVKGYDVRLKSSKYYHNKQSKIKLKLLESKPKDVFQMKLYTTICRMFLARKREAYAKENNLKY